MVHNNENAIILKPAFVQKTEPPGSSIEKKKARLIFTPQSLLTKFTKYLQKNCKHLQFIFKKQLKEINSSIIKLYRDITLQFTLRKNRVLKKDKNIDDQNRYFTLMIVPHSSSKVKTFKLSRSVVKFGIIFMVLIVTSSVYISIYISGIIAENNTLKSSMDSLYTIVNKQEADLNKKLAAIDTLIEKQNSANVDLAEYSNKFREIVDDYVTGRISSGITSRSTGFAGSSSERILIACRVPITAYSMPLASVCPHMPDPPSPKSMCDINSRFSLRWADTIERNDNVNKRAVKMR